MAVLTWILKAIFSKLRLRAEFLPGNSFTASDLFIRNNLIDRRKNGNLWVTIFKRKHWDRQQKGRIPQARPARGSRALRTPAARPGLARTASNAHVLPKPERRTRARASALLQAGATRIFWAGSWGGVLRADSAGPPGLRSRGKGAWCPARPCRTAPAPSQTWNALAHC